MQLPQTRDLAQSPSSFRWLGASPIQHRHQTNFVSLPLIPNLSLFTTHPLLPTTLTMEQLHKAMQNVAPLGQRLSKGFNSLGQQVGNLGQVARERFGNVDEQDITELPQEYKDLEARVDALKMAHQTLGRVAKAFETEGYDYPVSWWGGRGGGVLHRWYGELTVLSTSLCKDSNPGISQPPVYASVPLGHLVGLFRRQGNQSSSHPTHLCPRTRPPDPLPRSLSSSRHRSHPAWCLSHQYRRSLPRFPWIKGRTRRKCSTY